MCILYVDISYLVVSSYFESLLSVAFDIRSATRGFFSRLIISRLITIIVPTVAARHPSGLSIYQQCRGNGCLLSCLNQVSRDRLPRLQDSLFLLLVSAGRRETDNLLFTRLGTRRLEAVIRTLHPRTYPVLCNPLALFPADPPVLR